VAHSPAADVPMPTLVCVKKGHRFACRRGSETDWGNEGRHYHGNEDYRGCQAREVTPISAVL
jgi:hypothetical protein